MVRCAAAMAAMLMVGCMTDRPRPSPSENDDRAVLFVQVLKPENNAVVAGAHPIDVEIYAADLEGERLTGLGYVVRHNGERVDSVVRHFNPRTDSLRTFVYPVPDLPTNTQLDISGHAFGTHGDQLEGPPVMVIVVRCPLVNPPPGCS
jgi:hypothetical protein